jgi:hypothetical protein
MEALQYTYELLISFDNFSAPKTCLWCGWCGWAGWPGSNSTGVTLPEESALSSGIKGPATWTMQNYRSYCKPDNLQPINNKAVTYSSTANNNKKNFFENVTSRSWSGLKTAQEQLPRADLAYFLILNIRDQVSNKQDIKGAIIHTAIMAKLCFGLPLLLLASNSLLRTFQRVKVAVSY